MINTSPAFKKAVVADTRKVDIQAAITIIDPSITYTPVTASDTEPVCNLNQIHNKITELAQDYATVELNRWILDGKLSLEPADELGWLSQEICDENGIFNNPPWIQLNFTNVSVLQALSVYFVDQYYNGHPAEFTVEVIQGGTTYFSRTFEENEGASVSLDGFKVYNPDSIRVTVKKWSLPHRRARVVEIVAGVLETWNSDRIADFSLKHQGDISMTSLPYGTCSIMIDNSDRRFEPRRKSSLFESIEEQQGIDVDMGVQTSDGISWVQMGRYYQYNEGWTTSNNGLSIRWDLVDIIGLLADRDFIISEPLPTTLDGWTRAVVSQLGENFAEAYRVDERYSDLSVTVNSIADIKDKKVGDVIRFICQATGTWARGGGVGELVIEPLWNQGNKITLDNLEYYPTMKNNPSVAAITVAVYDGTSNPEKIVISGNNVSASNTVSVDNPFIHTREQAIQTAKMIIATYGGNQFEITGRGDPSGEIGDVDTIWLDESSAVTARRIEQDLSFRNGVLSGCTSTLLQADGSFMYQNREIITESGTWISPEGVTSLRIIVVGGGSGSENGTDGTWDYDGTDGLNGMGGFVYAATIPCNNRQAFDVAIGMGGAIAQAGTPTTFGPYSSVNGQYFEYGYTDVASGSSYAREGVTAPVPHSGDGAKGGAGGLRGLTHTESDGEVSWEVIDRYPTPGEPGRAGASGCVVVYYDKEA